MSYCRWSTRLDAERCDVYVYADVFGGWTTNVAACRYPSDSGIGGAAVPQDASQDERPAPIGLRYDGSAFNDTTPGACAQRLLQLRETGYHVPQRVIDRLTAEQEQLDHKAPAAEGQETA